MITDALLSLSSAQAVTASAVSTNNIDLSLTRDLASGSDLYVHFSVDENATAVGAATVQFQIVSSASVTLSSPTVLASTGAISKGDLTAGRRPFALGLASAIVTALNLGQRYLGVQYVVAAGPLTTGRFSAVVSESTADVGKIYPSTGFKAL